MEGVQLVSQLGTALWKLKVMYDRHVDNKSEIKELQSFIEDYGHQIPTLEERFKAGGGNVMGIAAFKTLEKDIMEALDTLEGWSKDKSFFRVLNSTERMENLGKLYSKVMASVQKSLGIANLSLLLDVQASQSTILESTMELKSLLITSIGNTRGTLPIKVREEVIEASSSSFVDTKFWEDVLAIVNNQDKGCSSNLDYNMYEDPITAKLMIDPIVASDGNTYCRWTIIDHQMRKNPFNVYEDLTIVVDNLAFRRGLFEKFPSQYEIFRQRRLEYRSHALSLQGKGLFGDAVSALQYVLQWAKDDAECVKALQEVQGALEEAKENCFVGSSDVQGTKAPPEHVVYEVVQDDQNLCDILVHDLASVNPLDHEGALKCIFTRSEGDDEFCSLMVQNGVVPLLIQLIPSSNCTLELDVLTVLMRLSVNNSGEMLDAAGAAFEVLERGSAPARELAATILFNLSSKDPRVVGSYSGAVRALVIAFGDRTNEALNKILTQTLSILCAEDGTISEAINAGVVPILVNLIAEQPATILDEALPLVESLLDDSWGLFSFRNRIPASAWLDIIASESPVDRQRAASIFYKLCCGGKQYREDARACGAVERIEKLDPFPNSTLLLKELRPKPNWFRWKK